MKRIFMKYKDIIPYAIFGVLTTCVNIVVYWCCAHMLNCSVMLGTIIAWILAVLFAYVTNRKWVFHSNADGKTEVIKELISFFSCRIATGLVDWVCMFVFVNILRFDDLIIKTAANFLVIILNYLASKLLIFKN